MSKNIIKQQRVTMFSVNSTVFNVSNAGKSRISDNKISLSTRRNIYTFLINMKTTVTNLTLNNKR